MLKSRDPAALRTLFRAGARILATPVDLMLSVFERRLVAGARDAGDAPMVLIVGGPRAGTTLVFQVLSRQLDVATTTNVVDVFPRSPIVASRLLGALGPHRGKGPLHAFYGNTAPFRGPNDAFEIWNRWLGSDRYRAAERLDSAVIDDMRSFFSAWTAAAGRPLLNKNNRNTGVMGLLAEALPAAYFVVVERDPLYVAQSLLVAREVVQGDRAAVWGFGAQVDEPDPITSVADQVVAVERTIERETAKVDSDRLTRVSYEEFCADPGELVRAIGDSLGIGFETSGIPSLAASNTRRLPPDEFSRLETAIRDRRGR